MFREMRRKKQELSYEECISVLNKCTSGVLAVEGDDSYPYTVPLSYSIKGDELYFHCAKIGHKLDSIARNNKVSFCVIDKDEIIPEKFTTHYRSVIVFGKAKIVEDLVEKYSKGFEKEGALEIEKALKATNLVKIKIEHVTGKVAKELI
ncbi:MAG: pyridoxamine 5'-phosphate oxidase family protein [Clostridium sp.]|nr:pyridoxamine 5'-phosphate oxidase family protein [Clostridium sp.]